jgi:sensor histidine kinase regulating citrate/malate metabolism
MNLESSINSVGLIFAYNESAEKILSILRSEAIGNNYVKIIPQIQFEQVLESAIPIKNKLVKIKDIDMVLSVFPVINSNVVYGICVKKGI